MASVLFDQFLLKLEKTTHVLHGGVICKKKFVKAILENFSQPTRSDRKKKPTNREKTLN